MSHKFFVILVLILVGCGANSSPTLTPFAVPSPSPVSVSAPTRAAPTASPASTLTNDDLLRIFPLKEGARWVYRQDAYETIPNDALPQRADRTITATVLITDTVVETQTHAQYYAARVVRETTIVTTSLPLEALGEDGKAYFASTEPDVKWYVFDSDRIHIATEPLLWEAIDQSFLAYRLPLKTGACWYPNLGQDCDPNEPLAPESRGVQRAPRQRLPAGDFDICFAIYDFYNSGPLIHRVCEGVGIVGEDYDHSGTPFGSHSQLIAFTAGQ